MSSASTIGATTAKSPTPSQKQRRAGIFDTLPLMAIANLMAHRFSTRTSIRTTSTIQVALVDFSNPSGQACIVKNFQLQMLKRDFKNLQIGSPHVSALSRSGRDGTFSALNLISDCHLMPFSYINCFLTLEITGH